LIFAATTVPVHAESVAGDWHGVLNVGEQHMGLVLHVTATGKTEWKATMDSPDQQQAVGALAMGMKMDSFTVAGSSVDFEIKAIQAKFAGKLNAQQNAIKGTWSQIGSTWPLEFTKKTPTRSPAPAGGSSRR
jgi:hypothetical protein